MYAPLLKLVLAEARRESPSPKSMIEGNNDPSRFPAPIDISVHGHFLVHGAGDARDFNLSTEIFKICRDTGAKTVYSVPGCDNQRRQLKWEKILLSESDGGGERW